MPDISEILSIHTKPIKVNQSENYANSCFTGVDAALRSGRGRSSGGPAEEEGPTQPVCVYSELQSDVIL